MSKLSVLRSKAVQYVVICSMFVAINMVSCLVFYLIGAPEMIATRADLVVLNQNPSMIEDPALNVESNEVLQEIKLIEEAPSISPENVSFHQRGRPIPTLWIFGPAKTSTTSIYTALARSFPNWHHPEHDKPFKEYYEIWTLFLTEGYFNRKADYQELVRKLEYYVNGMHGIDSLAEYPFDDLLSLISPSRVIERRIEYQHTVFAAALNASRYDEDMMVVVKTPAHFYSPYIPIIFAHHFATTKTMIILRNTVHRTVSWYSLFYINKFIAAQMNESAVFDLVRHQIEVSLRYEPLLKFRKFIHFRSDEADDARIITEYFKFFYGFSLLFKECNALHFEGSSCEDIDIGLFDQRWNRGIPYKHIKFQRHPIHMLFAGTSYAQLLVPLTVFKQHNMLSSQFRLMSFRFIIENPKESLYLMTCWAEDVHCDSDKFKRERPEVWESIELPHQKHESQPVRFANGSDYLNTALTQFYKPIISQIHALLERFEEDDAIFLGGWNGDDL